MINNINNIRYIFPKTVNFREERPEICWEHMYGWIDGYGMFFDPAILNHLGIIPEWENGFQSKVVSGDFLFVRAIRQRSIFPVISCRREFLYARQ